MDSPESATEDLIPAQEQPMDVSCLAQIESCANELARAAKSLAEYNQTTSNPEQEQSTGLPSVAAGAPNHVHRARRTILAGVAKLQTLVREPSYFLQQLATQNQLLACLHWLGEFQVLACIPLHGSVPSRDIAELTGVPESILMRVVRMTSTAGFLCEPQPQHVAHTSLSADFVTRPSLVDAALLIADKVTRAALHMATATQRYGEPEGSEQSAYTLSEQVPQSFRVACEQSPRLQRQWTAYVRSSADVEECVAEVLSRLEWERQRSACIVEAGPYPSCIVRRIADRYSHLHITVQQISEPSLFDGVSAYGNVSNSGSQDPFEATVIPTPSLPAPAPAPSTQPLPSSLARPLASARVSVQRRAVGQPQAVRNADVYVLHLGSPSTAPSESLACLTSRLTAELRAHVPVLRDNSTATLVVAMRLLPDPGSVDACVEAVARMHDLVLLQLANERDLEVGEVVHLIQSVGDRSGNLVVINRARARNNAIVALGVKFQPAGSLTSHLEPNGV